MRESYHWVRSCILSSWTEFHLKCCHTLIELFKKQFEEDKESKLMVEDLLMDIRNKETEIKAQTL